MLCVWHCNLLWEELIKQITPRLLDDVPRIVILTPNPDPICILILIPSILILILSAPWSWSWFQFPEFDPMWIPILIQCAPWSWSWFLASQSWYNVDFLNFLRLLPHVYHTRVRQMAGHHFILPLDNFTSYKITSPSSCQPLHALFVFNMHIIISNTQSKCCQCRGWFFSLVAP